MTDPTAGDQERFAFLDQPLEETFGIAALLDSREVPTDDVGLRFYLEVLGLRHLHYGLWEPSDPRTLAGLMRAQERYLERLLELVPDGTERILDVGCGAGGNATVLQARGWKVEGLSPDASHGERFREATEAVFHHGKLQDFAPERPYDLVLMSESAQYVPLDRLFPSIRAALAPAGRVVLSDYFVLERDGSYVTRSGHVHAQFLIAMEAAGFEIEEQEDVTDRAAPSLDVGCAILERFLFPSIRLALVRGAQKRPRLTRSVARLLRKRVRKLDVRLQNLDSALFREKKRYLFYRLRTGH